MGSVSFKRLFGTHDLADFTNALCADEACDPDLWYSDETVKQDVAVRVCQMCPLGPNGTDACLTKVLNMETETKSRPYGVAGAVTAADRVELMGWRFKPDDLADVLWGYDLFEGDDSD